MRKKRQQAPVSDSLFTAEVSLPTEDCSDDGHELQEGDERLTEERFCGWHPSRITCPEAARISRRVVSHVSGPGSKGLE
ncbi:MAG: hypothetical protein ACLFWM_14100, partial [Actinomycetota bacterium]